MRDVVEIWSKVTRRRLTVVSWHAPFGNWTSIEEATANGTLTVEYANEWATYLEPNGCSYRDAC